MTSRKAIMKSMASSLSLVILAVFDDEGAKRPALQEVFENDVVVGGSEPRSNRVMETVEIVTVVDGVRA